MSDGKTDNTVAQTMGIEIFGSGGEREKRQRPNKTVREAARDIPVFRETDVLVIGGGPAGTAAAIGAGRLGADVTLVERYNHLGGLSTGGLVIWIDRMSDWSGKQVIAGVACDLFDRLPKDAVLGPPRKDWGSKDQKTAEYWFYRSATFQNIVTWSPTIDPEALKTLSMDMLLEQNVNLTLHAWAAEPIVEDGVMRGAIFESKEGRQAILAKVVIDTTGDADMLARANVTMESDIDSSDIHHCINTAFMVAGVDMERWTEFRANKQAFSDFMQRGREKLKYFEKPFFSWRSDIALFMGPRLSGYSAVDLDDLNTVEITSRRLTVGHLEFYREHAPGFENGYLMLGAPQVGVRHSRRMAGLKKVVRQDWVDGKIWDDEIGVSTSLAPKFPNVSVPYGSLLPAGIDGVLAAGRHIACDANSHTFLREIPQCWLTGQAAGVAAGIAANSGALPRDLDHRLIQHELLKQGAYLSPSVEAALAEKIPSAAE